MKHLVASGCSFVAGTSMHSTHNKREAIGLTPKQQEELRFTRLISNKLALQETNLASSGSSNQRAIRLIYEWIQSNEEKVKDTVFVLGLTEILRKEKFSSDLQLYVKWRPTTYFNKDTEVDSEKLLPSSTAFAKHAIEHKYLDSIIEYVKTELLHFTDIGYEFSELSRILDLLNVYIESKGGKLVVFAAMLEVDKEVSFEFNILGKLNIGSLNFFTFPAGHKNWKAYIKSYDEHYHVSRHPAIADEKKLADLLTDYITNLWNQ